MLLNRLLAENQPFHAFPHSPTSSYPVLNSYNPPHVLPVICAFPSLSLKVWRLRPALSWLLDSCWNPPSSTRRLMMAPRLELKTQDSEVWMTWQGRNQPLGVGDPGVTTRGISSNLPKRELWGVRSNVLWMAEIQLSTVALVQLEHFWPPTHGSSHLLETLMLLVVIKSIDEDRTGYWI